MPTPNGCTGACCTAFHLIHDPGGLQAAAERAQRVDALTALGGIDGTEEWTFEGPVYRDIVQIADMVVYLREVHPDEFNGSAYPKVNGVPVHAPGHHYTCKHFDVETKRCTDYDNRPEMCRAYPYGGPCQHGCGIDHRIWNYGGPGV